MGYTFGIPECDSIYDSSAPKLSSESPVVKRS